MRKKFLGALLIGAFLFASTGTFTSCKDYDDDISDLRTQVDGVKADLEDLQAQVNAGYWITSVTSIDGGFSVTFSNGQSYDIVNGANGADGADGTPGTQISIGEDGYWYFDGVKSDYLAVANDEDGKINVPYVDATDGYWYFYNEDGKAVKSDYKAVGAAYAVAANGGYNLYLPDANGEMGDPIFLPGAGASITDMELRDLDGTGSISATELNVYATKFTFNGNGIFNSASQWGGTKALPADNSVVYSTNQLGLRINPANVDGTEVEYVMTTSQNNTLSNLTLKATEYKGLVNTRAAYGNGLYTLKMDNTVLSESQAKTLADEITKYTSTAMFAVNADRTIRTDYAVKVQTAVAQQLTAIQLGNDASTQISLNGSSSWNDVKVGQTYTVNGVQASALYDLYCVVDNTTASAYGITIDNANHTFTVGKNPDSSTTNVHFPMTVYTAANDGAIAKTTVEVYLSSEIPSTSEYAEITKNVSDSNKTFSFDLATMENGLADLTSWKLNVDLANTQYKLYEKYTNGTLSGEVTGVVGANQLFTPTVINANGGATNDVNAATDIRIAIDNSKAAAAGMELEKTYYLEVTYVDKIGSKLNSSVIPVQFTAPALETMFSVRSGYVSEGVINAYFDVATGKTITLDKYFSTDLSQLTGVAYNLDNKTTVLTDNNTDYTTSQVVTIDESTRELDFVATKKHNSQFELGYGVDLIINATKDNYEGWKYAEEADGIYTFEIKMMSPIAEGTVRAVNSTVTISANDLVNGAAITGNDITGADYNGNTYVVVPDKYDDGNAAWNNPQIQDVTMTVDKDGYITRVDRNAATYNSQTKVTTAGNFTVFGNSLSTTTNVELPVTVTDAWGYTVKANIPVTINVN